MEPTFDGATKIAQSQFTKMRWALGLNGLFSVVVGVVILIWPGISLDVLTILFGAYALASGVVGLIAAQNEQLLDLSRQILELTQELHRHNARAANGVTPGQANRGGHGDDG